MQEYEHHYDEENAPGKLDNVVGSMFSGYPVNIGY